MGQVIQSSLYLTKSPSTTIDIRPKYSILPLIILSNCIVLALAWYELCNGVEESLTINRFLYCKIAKIVPVFAFFVGLAVEFVHSTAIEMWVWSLFLIP